jgi:hypothetical protein
VPWFGVFGTMDHVVPFQVSARLAGVGPVVAAAEPTALHVVALKQLTPVRPLFAVVEVSGTLVAITHWVPFHDSIRFWESGPARLVCPTAWQKVTPAHDTELNWLPTALVGCGVARSVHAVPFQSSLKDVAAAFCVPPYPTAMHQLAVTQSIPDALSLGVVEVVGVDAVVDARVVPFHWLPKIEFVPATAEVPRTSHVVAETQETDERGADVLPAGAAAGTNDHAVPFHVSATDGPVLDPPTARQKAVPTHDTEFSALSVVAGAFTLGTTVHFVPFHCSMRVPPPVPTFSEPTATQKVEVVQDTSFSTFEPDPAAALPFVQFVAATVGGLVMVLAPAGEGAATNGPAKSAISVPAAATRNIRNAGMTAPSSSLACSPATVDRDGGAVE